jgi:hypothetical protein
MIDCYTWTTDNGYKPRMMLEEAELPHKIVPVNIREKAQMSPEFMKLARAIRSRRSSTLMVLVGRPSRSVKPARSSNIWRRNLASSIRRIRSLA